MLGPLDYMIWLSGFLLEAAVVVCVVFSRSLARYYAVAVYMLCQAAVEYLHYVCIARFGVSSPQYNSLYFYTESLLTILLFCVIIQFYQQVFADLNVGRYIRGGASTLLFATAMFSYLVVRGHSDHLTKQFVIEFGQDLYFVGVVLTYLLWAAILHFRETRTRLIHLVLALGLYFSGTAAAYALRNLFPDMQAFVLQWVPPLFGTLLPLAWAYTFWRVPEEARLLTYQLEARAR